MNSSSDAAVALVAIGDELLAGKHPDLNSPWMAERLLDLDLAVDRIVVANDDLEELTQIFRDLCSRYRYVISSGGLGPTLDDITRHAAAQASGVALVQDPEVLTELRRWWSERGYAMSSANERQALFPEGATMVDNRMGTAPGFRTAVGDAWLISLPGPPREIQVVFDEEVFPWLASEVASSEHSQRFAKQTFYLYGVPESRFAEEVGPWMDRPQNPLMSVTASLGVLTVVLRAQGPTSEAAQALLEPRAREFRERFGERIFSESESSLAAALGGELLRSGLTLATAESCTGGLVSGQLTELPGISGAFTHGFVTYSNEAKTELLGVPTGLLAEHGAVSREVALAMAEGARRAAGADLAVSITGIAGPDGGTDEKPVGTVWFGVARGERSVAVRRNFSDRGRSWVRTLATQTALDLALRAIPGDCLPDLD